MLGTPAPVSPDDPLVQAALETKKLALVHDDMLEGQSPLLAVVPFVAVDGSCHGLLAIHAMPFIAFEESNLRLLSVLAGRVGDMMSETRSPHRGHRRGLLELYVKRARREARLQGSSHALAVITFRARTDASVLLEKLEAAEVRSADSSVLLYDESMTPVLCVVLPMIEWADATAFQRRVDGWCRNTLGQTMGEAGGDVRLVRVGGPRTAAELVREILNGGMDHESPASSLRTS